MKEYTAGFSSFDASEDEIDLVVQGSIPNWLRGTFLRNGPGKFEINNEKYRHWFDGLALLTRCHIHDNGIKYQSKFLRSNAFKKSAQEHKIKFSEFATNPKLSFYQQIKSLFLPQFTDNANINTIQLGDRIIAMTETAAQTEIDLNNLATKGIIQYQDRLVYQATTAHPHYDFLRQEMINCAIKYGKQSEYLFLRVPEDSLSRQIIGTVPVKSPGYIHSFAITENYCILMEGSLRLDPIKLLYMDTQWGKPFIENFNWQPQQNSRFIIVDKHNGNIVCECAAEAFFSFHTINAYENNNEIIIDISAYSDPGIINNFYLDKIRNEKIMLPRPELRRYRLSLNGNRDMHYKKMSVLPLEFPRINYQPCNGREYQYIYGASINDERAGLLNQLIKVDLQNHQEKIWRQEHCYPGEPIFVAAPAANSEDEGVIISMVFNAEKNNAFLLLLDAISFQELARAEISYLLPFGLHGQFFLHDIKKGNSA